jgi:hypothetical protein
VIDGRQYSNPEDVRRDVLEARETFRGRRLLREVETRPIEPDAPPVMLPTWGEYKRHLLLKDELDP